MKTHDKLMEEILQTTTEEQTKILTKIQEAQDEDDHELSKVKIAQIKNVVARIYGKNYKCSESDGAFYQYLYKTVIDECLGDSDEAMKMHGIEIIMNEIKEIEERINKDIQIMSELRMQHHITMRDILHKIILEYNVVVQIKGKFKDLSVEFINKFKPSDQYFEKLFEEIFAALYEYYNKKIIPQVQVDDIKTLAIAQPQQKKSKLSRFFSALKCCSRKKPSAMPEAIFRTNMQKLINELRIRDEHSAISHKNPLTSFFSSDNSDKCVDNVRDTFLKLLEDHQSKRNLSNFSELDSASEFASRPTFGWQAPNSPNNRYGFNAFLNKGDTDSVISAMFKTPSSIHKSSTPSNKSSFYDINGYDPQESETKNFQGLVRQNSIEEQKEAMQNTL